MPLHGAKKSGPSAVVRAASCLAGAPVCVIDRGSLEERHSARGLGGAALGGSLQQQHNGWTIHGESAVAENG
jgi:hypothetical protein